MPRNDEPKAEKKKEIDRYDLIDKDRRNDIDFDEYIRRRQGGGRVVRKPIAED